MTVAKLRLSVKKKKSERESAFYHFYTSESIIR